MYQALYRKWRPQTFDEVSGQPHVTTTLKNELEGGRISHAYLFTGSRGTGKTSCAKILAKAVNCLTSENGNPCGRCEICTGIDSGSLLDVIEIDAASNNGVDNIRDIREEVNFTPVRCKYRVYIIDEVHMLSAGAFNALLKTLEEPPSHVIFILATTEVHKLPATVLSRCQRFDFKRISPEAISARLLHIAKNEGFALTEGAAALIARIADGGMRDAVSLLDRCCAKDSEIDETVVRNAAGIAGTQHLFSFSKFIAQGDFSAAIKLVTELHSEACDIESLCTELTFHFRNLMLAKTVKDCRELIICSQAELEELRERSGELRLSKILQCLDILEETGKSMKGVLNKRIQLESAVIRMCAPLGASDAEGVDNTVIEQLVRRIESLEQRLSGAPAAVKAAQAAPIEPTPAPTSETAAEEKPSPENTPEPTPKPEKKPEPAAKPEAAAESSEPAAPTTTPKDFTPWTEVLAELNKTDVPLAALLKNTTAFISNGTHLVIRTDNPVLFRFINSESHSVELRRAVFNVTGEKYRLAVKELQPREEQKKNPLEDLTNKINIFNNNNTEEPK